MKEQYKFALDSMFTFMLFVTIGIFLVSQYTEVIAELFQAIETIDFAILGGYYLFFIHGIYYARNKIKYVKQHWILLTLLIIPFLPITRILRFAKAEHLLKIGSDTLWHLLDHLELL